MAKGVAKYSDEFVMSKIHMIRGQKVMLDSDLGPLFGVEVKRLKEQVRRNIQRFPADFMFELASEELEHLRSQFATSSHGGARYAPMAFTEHGVLMLSNVLRSERAVLLSIQVIRVFTRMREMLLTHKDLLLELEKLRTTSKEHGRKIDTIFRYLKQLEKREQDRVMLAELERSTPRPAVGFKLPKQKKSAKKKPLARSGAKP